MPSEDLSRRTGAMGEVNATRKSEVLLLWFSIRVLHFSVLFCVSHFYCQALRESWGVHKAPKATSNLGGEAT